jgi:hypothetical protein
VEALDGVVEITSPPGVGTTLRVRPSNTALPSQTCRIRYPRRYAAARVAAPAPNGAAPITLPRLPIHQHSGLLQPA